MLRTLLLFIFFGLICFLLPAAMPAFAQDPTVATDPGLPKWATLLLALIVPVCGAITAAFPSTNKFMAVIDIFALNWGKARNDPNAQRWGDE